MSTEASPRRIPSLDGLRALSIAVVLVEHLAGTRNFPLESRAFGAAGDVGYLGVRTFFVISGYLITYLLLREHEKTGTVSLRGFYARRAFRIFPAFYAFILVMATAGALGVFTMRDGDLGHALTYTMNYHYVRSWELGHLWSLSVEEQFYFLWPAVLLLAGPRRIGHVAAAMVAAAPALRVLAWFFMPYRDDVIFEAYPCIMDSIATGSLLAILRPRLDTAVWYQRLLRSGWFVLVPLVVVVANGESRVSIDYVLDPSLQNVGIALIIDRCVRVDRGAIFWVLNTRPMVWLGTLSYSLYLWQEPFLNPKARTSIAAWPLNLALALVCALASYHLVEKRFFALREAWERKRTSTAAVESAPTS